MKRDEFNNELKLMWEYCPHCDKFVSVQKNIRIRKSKEFTGVCSYCKKELLHSGKIVTDKEIAKIKASGFLIVEDGKIIR